MATVTEPRTPDEWLGAVKSAERGGDLLTAFDLAERGLAEHPGDVWLEHRAVLALARAGATEEAARRFDGYGLADVGEEDVVALRARIAKDVALAATGAERRREAAHAAALYAAIYARTGSYYPAVNAATLHLVAGERERARALAREVLDLIAQTGERSYYAAASEAEAHLLLTDESSAAGALARAAELHGSDYGAISTTRRQLRLVCELTGVDQSLVGALAGPAVVHFCGHRIAAPGEDGRFPAEAEAEVARRIASEVERHPAGYAYGSLASGADILFAEALLERGCELHVVLPFDRDEFVESSVAPSGQRWVERFDTCLERATEVSFATDDAFLGDDVLYRYGTELAMGLALLRARYLDAEVSQLAVWDGGPAHGDAGTAIDVATWHRHRRSAVVIAPGGELPDPATPPPVVAGGGDRSSGRVVAAMLFADVKGFSKLTDEQLPRFASRVLGAFAEVLDRYTGDVWHRNTWGDALYVVVSGPALAAACSLELQEAMEAIDLEAEGLPAHLALRLGGHVGPVFPTTDPVLDVAAFMGSHVSRTARIEPVTPPGTVYVTEPFAAALVLDDRREFGCDYVGYIPAAKDYGHLRMYRLRRRAGTAV